MAKLSHRVTSPPSIVALQKAYSITSSARTSTTDGGTPWPFRMAVLLNHYRLMFSIANVLPIRNARVKVILECLLS
jgi:hypothetical protein